MYIDPALLTNSTHHSQLLDGTHRYNVYDADIAYHIRNAERLRSIAVRDASLRATQWLRRTARSIFSAPSFMRHA